MVLTAVQENSREDTERAPEMNSHWQDQLLALVDHYGQQCAQLAAERVRGTYGHPPADRAAAWAAILSHLANAPHETSTAEPPRGKAEQRMQTA
jgi:hypothetical protein